MDRPAITAATAVTMTMNVLVDELGFMMLY